jgi:uroporphyrinogen decarboxylase
MYSQPELWNALMSRLTRIVSSYLLGQVHAGVDAVQLFDSWSGCLSPTDYREFVLPYNKEILESLFLSRVPRIHFGVGTAGILRTMKEAGGDVVGVDWRIPIDEAWDQVGDLAIQGNLDPATLLGHRSLVEARTREILVRIGGRPGHVFNLGHGILPDTSPEMAKELVQFVHNASQHHR